MKKNIAFQDYNNYLEHDHMTWSKLYRNQYELKKDYFSEEYLKGLTILGIDEHHIARIEDISIKLEKISGWTLIPVDCLLPANEFFPLLITRRYPVLVNIRPPREVDDIKHSDIFQDIYCYIPLLTIEPFVKFLTSFSTLFLKYNDNEKAITALGNFYWYICKMGLINENGSFKSFGGAIILSIEQTKNTAITYNIIDYKSIIEKIRMSSFSILKSINEYFYINSFEDLSNSLKHLEQILIDFFIMPENNNTLTNFDLNQNLGHKFNDVIGFLNSIQSKYPKALSFVAGQPDESFFDIEYQLSSFSRFVDHLAETIGEKREKVFNSIGQYNKTKGIINDLVSQYLKNDENIHISPENIIITVGAQEAFSIIVSTICNRDRDVILMESPSYVGISSFAQIFDYQFKGVSIDENGMNLLELEKKINSINDSGKRVKLVYIIPDYQNPSGSCMPIINRLKILELAQRYNFLIIEDSVYNNFTYEKEKKPTLKSLDKFNKVIFVGSFSKSIFPGLRVGLIAADQKIECDLERTTMLINEMVKVKAQITNNTSTISQAIIGGVLLKMNCSLNIYNRPKYENYKLKRDYMLRYLEKYIGFYSSDWAKNITWNKPNGGFFIKMIVPFNIDNKSVIKSASEFNIIFCPMRFFYLESGGENEIRLAFSNLSKDQIREGIKRLAEYLKYRANNLDEILLVEDKL